jgi:hypothetical protein
MEALSITQEQFDDIVVGIGEHQVDLAYIAIQMRRQGDPDAGRRERESIFIMNILDALKNYDLEYETLTDDEIYYLQELATLAVQSCPE